jgi:hypothetical protein
MTAPQNVAVVQGIGAINADNLNTFMQWCTIASVLRTFIGLPGMTIYLQGITAPDDGSEGTFVWQATVTQPDDNLNYIIPQGASGGGWVRQGPLLPLPTITGVLSAVTDSNAKTVLTSIVAALVAQQVAIDGTT